MLQPFEQEVVGGWNRPNREVLGHPNVDQFFLLKFFPLESLLHVLPQLIDLSHSTLGDFNVTDLLGPVKCQI